MRGVELFYTLEGVWIFFVHAKGGCIFFWADKILQTPPPPSPVLNGCSLNREVRHAI